jgi:hypothetical protein
MPHLTIKPMVAILSVLFPHGAARFDSRKKHKMPHKARLVCRLRSSMQVIIYGGRYLGSESSQDSCVLSVNPSNVHRPIFDRIKRCPQVFTRTSTMPRHNSAQKPTPDAYGIYRVNPDSTPPKGFKQLCNQCHFDHFSGAYRYCPNCGAEAVNHCRYVEVVRTKKPR